MKILFSSRLLALSLSLLLFLTACAPDRAPSAPTGGEEGREAPSAEAASSAESTANTPSREETTEASEAGAWPFPTESEPLLVSLPYYKEGKFVALVDSGTHGKQIVLSETARESFLSYLDRFAEAGFSLYAEHAIGENLYRTYRNDSAVVQAIFLAADREVRLIIDPAASTALPPREEENLYRPTVRSSITQVGLEKCDPSDPNARLTNGMQYIIRLADSSFIIVDGGFRYPKCAELLYEHLRSLASDPEHIVISAWFLTHFHGDHHGLLKNFAPYARKGITVERVICNCPAPAQLKTADAREDLESAVLGEVLAAFPSAETVCARPGQVFSLRNARVTVLSTFDLLEPYRLTDLNETSLVFRVEIEGQSILFSGDLQYAGITKLMRIYGEALRSDFVQVVHHGADGATADFYRLADPQIVLWPVGLQYYQSRNMKGQSNNAPLFDPKSRVKELHIAGSTAVTLPLPYGKVT